MGKTIDFPENKNSLVVTDNRTGKSYSIPYVFKPLDNPFIHSISGHFPRIVDNSIPATAFKSISAPRASNEREENETERGLRVVDKGFMNTAVINSEITYIDGDKGGQCICAIVCIALELSV